MSLSRNYLFLLLASLGFVVLSLVVLLGGDFNLNLKAQTLAVHGRAQEQLGHLVQLETRVSRLERETKDAR